MEQKILDRKINSSKTLRLLLVEDVPDDVALIEIALAEANFDCHIEVAMDADDCEQHLQQQLFDVMLSDYRLPNFTGLQAFKILKRSGQDIPFILVTGNLGDESAVECIKAGMTDYVLKDRLCRLPMVLKRALDEYELRRQQKYAIAQIQQQVWQQGIINQNLRAMRESLVLEDVLQSTAENLQQSLHVSLCLIIQYDEDLQVHTKSVCVDDFDKDSLLEAAHNLAFYYHDELSHGQQVVYHDLPQSHSMLRCVSDNTDITAFMISPLLYGQKYLGSISIYHCGTDRVWLEVEQSLLNTIADQCAIALHQAELYQRAQQELQERKKIEQKLRHDALHDQLTGLPNRTLMLDRLHHALNHWIKDSRSPLCEARNFAVLYLDLDQFKLVNDSLGHSAGDRLLLMAAKILRANLRLEDSLGRLGGDEFVVLLDGVNGLNEVLERVERIQTSFKQPIILGNHEVIASTSIGIVVSSSNYRHPEEVLRDADTALYRAKRNRRGSYVIFNPDMHAQVMSQLKTANYLRYAIEYQELCLLYQPIICLKQNKIIGFEALVRWNHPTLGLITPQNFIPIAEETGLIIPIDLWVLEHACLQLWQWQQSYPELESAFMSVNLSGQHFSQYGLVATLDRILKKVRLSPGCLTVEITENVLIEKTELAADILSELQARNISISLDDFGTGYTSLSYLHRFPINTIKLDRSFISQLGDNIRNQEIVKAIVDLGLNLGLRIVAEGIETLDHILLLTQFGCHAGQGYFFSRPIGSDVAEFWMRKRL